MNEICFRFGDKVPFEKSVIIPAVGNAANAAVSATRLGAKTAFITDIGDDDRGKKKLETLKDNGVNTEYVEVHGGMQSNYHYVLRFGPERTILIKHHEYPYELPKDMEPPKWFYFSSVGEHGVAYHDEIAEYLKAHPESKFAFQPGSFQIALGYERLKELYAETDIFFCNKEEARRILGKQEDDIKILLKDTHELGPKLVVITDGRSGAYTFDGEEVWHMPMYPDPAPPVDRTGAGDAFSSTFTTAIALGEDVPTALSWGPINSMNVVQYIGAREGLLTKEKLLEHLENAPADYKPVKI
jgi:sugar/nucleoside kinase (ribokinase family)